MALYLNFRENNGVAGVPAIVGVGAVTMVSTVLTTILSEAALLLLRSVTFLLSLLLLLSILLLLAAARDVYCSLAYLLLLYGDSAVNGSCWRLFCCC